MKQNSASKNYPRGFNLLELMIVVTIIGLLIVVVLIAQTESRNKAYNKALIRQVDEMVSALEIYFTDMRSYPSGTANPSPFGPDPTTIFCIGDGKVAGCIPGATVALPSSHIERELTPQYLARIPHSQAGPYSSLAYHRCTNTDPAQVSGGNPSCRETDFSIWYVLKGANRDCGRGQPAPIPGFTDIANYTLCRMQATK